MNYDDPRWQSLHGGYRIPYDPRNALRSIEANTNVSEAWAELWNELHHQGDVDIASYAAVPHLVRIHALRAIPDWNTYALVATIEEVRHEARNPRLPSWLDTAYRTALRKLVDLGLNDLSEAKDPTLVCSIFALIAFEKGIPTLGRMAMLEEDERQEMLEQGQID